MRFLGDVHGNWNQYRELIRDVPESIQLGDMGVGFPAECARHSQFIPDGLTENGVMFVGGALSIDRHTRTEGFDWWPDEELSTHELMDMIDRYENVEPRIMVTHDAPESVVNILFGANGKLKLNLPSRTRQALQSMFEVHQPEMWLFGHGHNSKNVVIKGTRFICLNELESMDIDI
jgi:hypothetical protein